MASSEIKKWAARTASSTRRGGGQVKIQQAFENVEEDDFESELILPDGPLHLHVVPRHPPLHSRSHSSELDETASSMSSTGTSGGSALFSDSSDEQSSSKDGNAGHAQDDDGEEEDERSNTIKANQLPASFASQLALSKAQAALEKAAAVADATPAGSSKVLQTGQIHNLGSHTQKSPQQTMDWDEDIEGLQGSQLRRPVVKQASFTSHISDSEEDWTTSSPVQKAKTLISESKNAKDDDDDVEGDFDLPEAVQQIKLSTSTLSRHRQLSTGARSPSPSLSMSSRQAEAWTSNKVAVSAHSKRPPSRQSTLSRSHGRSLTSHSRGSTFASTEDADFFDDIVLPSFFGAPSDVSSAGTPPSSVDSKAEKKLDLQKLLKERLASKAGIAEGKQRVSAGSAVNKGSIRSRYTEKLGEAFEEGLILDEEDESAGQSGMVATGSKAGQKDRLSSLPVTKAGKGSTLRKITSITLPQGTSTSDRTHILRSRPSISNLSVRAASPGPSQSLSRKKSVPFLSSAAGNDTARPASPSAHYAQPTRSFLARQQSSDGTYSSLTGAAISYHSSHLRSAFSSNSRPSTPASAGNTSFHPTSPSASSNNLASRLTQPTLASRAKPRHIPTGSDPSGRSSAFLGRPLPSSSSSSSTILRSGITSLPLTRELRQPARRKDSKSSTEQFGDGSELDGFDDLPINKEKEKRFMKAPVRRRQSSETTETVCSYSGDMLQSNKGKAPLGSKMTTNRERIESAPEKLQSISSKRRLGNISSDSTETTVSAAAGGKVTKAKVVTASLVEMKRPKLQLIKGLNGASLSKVQGEMKWNPILMKWEGNESSLRDFDNVLASSARPALISPVFGPKSPRHLYNKSPLSTPSAGISTSLSTTADEPKSKPQLGGVRVVGDMIFDPVRMSWFTVSQEGEEELNFEDDENNNNEGDTSMSSLQSSGGDGKPVMDAWEGGEQYRLKTRRSFAHDWSSNASETGQGDDENAWNYEEFKKKTLDAEKRNEEEMSLWKSLKSRRGSTSRQSTSHLYDIRDLVRD